MTEYIFPSQLDRAPSKEIFTPDRVRSVGRSTIRSLGLIHAGEEPDQVAIMQELDPVVETELNRHQRERKSWVAESFLPVDEEGKIIHRYMGPEESPLLLEHVRSAMLVNLLTEDNLPAYHRVIANNFGLDGPWGTWSNLWTAEEANHAYVMRAFLDLTRAIDPRLLESRRMDQMSQGYNVEKDPLHTLVYVTFQELATRISHRNTGLASAGKLKMDESRKAVLMPDFDSLEADDPIIKGRRIADGMLAQIASDENYHMIFYRNLVTAALEIAPNQTMQAILDEVMDFVMPGSNIKEFGHHALVIANSGIYNDPVHLKNVIIPILKQWKIFERDDFTGYGAQAREDLATIIAKKEAAAERFTQKQGQGLYDKIIARSSEKSAGGLWLPS